MSRRGERREKTPPGMDGGGLGFWESAGFGGAGGADAEVQLLHALDLVADVLEGADRTVGREAFEDGGQGVGDVGGLFGRGLHARVIEAGGGDEDDGRVQDVDVLLIGPDVAGLTAGTVLLSFVPEDSKNRPRCQETERSGDRSLRVQ